MLKYLVVVGALIQFLGVLHYLRDVLRGDNQPNRVSWLIWGIAPILGCIAAFSKGARWSLLPPFMAGVSPLLIFTASFFNPKGYWKLTKLDYACGALSLVALAVWWVTREANYAIAFAIASDGLAAVPTLIKGVKNPETESNLIFALAFFSTLTSFAVIPSWTFENYALPIYFCVIDAALFFSIFIGKSLHKKKVSLAA